MGDKRAYYRVDHRPLNQDEPIGPVGDHIGTLSPGHRRVEEMIRTKLASGDTIRGESLHVFESLDAAVKYFLPLAKAKGRHLYEVEVDADNIRHRGDMALYNAAAELLDKPEEMEKLVDQYCNGGESASPMTEVMVTQAVVKRVVKTADEGKRLFDERHGFAQVPKYDIREIVDQKKS